MDLGSTPELTSAEQAAVAAYEEAHVRHAGSVMGAVLDSEDTEEEQAERVGRAVEQIGEAYSRLSELAPSGTPGREGGMGYGELLFLL